MWRRSILAVIGTIAVLLPCSQGQPPKEKEVHARRVEIPASATNLGGRILRKDSIVAIPVTDAEGLADLIEDEASRQALAKQVDFAKEKLILIRWSSSSRDELSAKASKEKQEVHFEILWGKGNPLLLVNRQPRVDGFVIPRGIKWRITE
jgi:hypothetical protein